MQQNPGANVWFDMMERLQKKYGRKKKKPKKTGGVTKRRSKAEKKAYQAKLKAMTKRKTKKPKKAEMRNPYKEPSVYQWVSTFPG